MKLRWSALARRDIRSLADYYARIDPGLAERMETAVETEPLRLIDYLRMGTEAFVGDIRKWRVRGTPYLLYYRIAGDLLIVLRVLHSSRDVNF